VLLLALSTGNKLGLGLAAAAFVGFSLIVAMLIPRWRPQFPGKGLPVFLVISVLMFVGMLAAVEIFAKESESEAEAAGEPVQVTEIDYKIRLPETTLAPGRYTFEVRNDGAVPHNLTVKGPGVSKATPNFGAGQTRTLSVDLEPGTYDFYCSVPGHRQLGMEQKVTVS
jgi:uncharacterized cupredoxin-like copper-binding protein